jgi:hypothetical protein
MGTKKAKLRKEALSVGCKSAFLSTVFSFPTYLINKQATIIRKKNPLKALRLDTTVQFH